MLINLPPRSKADDSPKQVAQGCSDQHNTITITEAKEARSDKEKKSASDQTPYWYKSPEWVLVIVGIFTAAVVGWQSYETRRATNSQRNKDRARLSVEPLYEGCIDFDKIPEPNTFAESGVIVTQHGPSKAFNVRAKAAVTFDRPGEEYKKTEMGSLHIPTVIDEGSRSVNAIMSYFPILEPELHIVWQRKAFIRFYGYIAYDDVFGKSHKTSFRYVWEPETWESVPGEPEQRFISDSGGWRVDGRKKDNRAT